MQLFYNHNDPVDNQFTLDKEKTKYLFKVLRKRKGDQIHITNGKGNIFNTRIVEIKTDRCMLDVTSETTQLKQRNYYLHIGIAPTKNVSRFEWFLEKSTEIGIDEITPLICDYSERNTLRYERMDKIIVSAMEQSLKAYKPHLNELTVLRDFFKQNNGTQNFIAHCQYHNMPHTDLKNLSVNKTTSTVLIGPEGDFSEDEMNLAADYKFQALRLGNYRLRTETAGLMACSAFSINGS